MYEGEAFPPDFDVSALELTGTRDSGMKPWPDRDASAVAICSSGRGTFSSAAHLGQEMTVPAFLDETPRS